MMKWIFTVLIFLSVAFGVLNGRMDAVSSAALSECGGAIQLALTLAGSVCLWSGLMRVAQKSGLTERIALLLSPLTTRIFRNLGKASYAMQLITMNITANLLGLGNAATPLGLAAIQELAKDTPPELSGTANDNMVLLVVLNTASIQLIPTTVAVLRLKYGSANPMDIIPAVLLASLVSVTVALSLARVLNHAFPARSGKLPRAGRQQKKCVTPAESATVLKKLAFAGKKDRA